MKPFQTGEQKEVTKKSKLIGLVIGLVIILAVMYFLT